MTEYYLGSMAKNWLCRCPLCRKKHTRKIFYTGRVIPPWVYCEECDRTIKRGATEEIEYSPHDKRIKIG